MLIEVFWPGIMKEQLSLPKIRLSTALGVKMKAGI